MLYLAISLSLIVVSMPSLVVAASCPLNPVYPLAALTCCKSTRKKTVSSCVHVTYAPQAGSARQQVARNQKSFSTPRGAIADKFQARTS